MPSPIFNIQCYFLERPNEGALFHYSFRVTSKKTSQMLLVITDFRQNSFILVGWARTSYEKNLGMFSVELRIEE